MKYEELTKEELIRVITELADKLNIEVMKNERLRYKNAELHAEKEKFENIFKNIEDGIILIDEEGLITCWNKGMEKITGLKTSEVIGKPAIYAFCRVSPGIMVTEEKSAKRQYMLSYLSGKLHGVNKIVENEIIHMDGTKKVIQDIPRIQKTDKGYIIYSFIRDITLQKKTKEALKEQLGFIQKLINTIPSPIFFKDTNGIYKECNTAFEKLTGKSKQEILGKKAHDIFPKELADFYWQKDNMLIKNQGVQEYEALFPCNDGTLRNGYFHKATYSNSDGFIKGVVTIFVDITELKQTKNALRFSDERFYTVFHNSPFPMAIMKISNHVFVDINKKFLQLLGLTPSEVVGNTLQDLAFYIDPEDYSRAEKIIKEEGKLENFEAKLVMKSGQRGTGLFSTETIFLDGEAHILIICNDITKLRNFEKEMAQLDRLNLIGQMAGTLAHEVRQPLTALRGFLQMLGAQDKYKEHRHFFDFMQSELDRTNSILTNFLSLTRKKTSEFKLYNLNDIINDLYPLLQADALNKNKHLTLGLAPVPDIYLDRKEIHQLIFNLVRNGLEAIGEGKQVQIKTFIQREAVVLAIKDEGEGIDPQILDKLGTPFLTTKPEGTGLGLATCYSIVDRHNATIHVDTSCEGTIFSVKFKTNSGYKKLLNS